MLKRQSIIMMFHKQNKIVNAIEKVDNFIFSRLAPQYQINLVLLAKFLKKHITGCWYYKENAMNFSD